MLSRALLCATLIISAISSEDDEYFNKWREQKESTLQTIEEAISHYNEAIENHKERMSEIEKAVTHAKKGLVIYVKDEKETRRLMKNECTEKAQQKHQEAKHLLDLVQKEVDERDDLFEKEQEKQKNLMLFKKNMEKEKIMFLEKDAELLRMRREALEERLKVVRDRREALEDRLRNKK